MQNLRKRLFIFFLLSSACARAQDSVVIQEYINEYKDLAIVEMQRTGVPAAIKLAQGIHETMAGTSDLVLKSNNHFGIKCKDTWRGPSVYHDDDLRGECFRKYPAASDSYRDHSDFLKGSSRYASLFNLDPMDYTHWAYGLKKAGYATNPRYPQIIIRLIEQYHLQDYTLIAMGKATSKDDPVTAVVVEEERKESTPVLPVVRQEEPVLKAKPSENQLSEEKLNYPEGEFRINETRVVFAKKGSSFLGIAQQYDVPLARIFEFNDIPQSEVVSKDQVIFLQRKRKTGNNEFHTVAPGETLHDIAQEEALRLETLLEYNWLTTTMKPAIGEKLYLRAKAPGSPALALKENYALVTMAPAISKPGKAIHIAVQPKETIYSISSKYQVKIDDIVKWNRLPNYRLKPGQVLKIYK